MLAVMPSIVQQLREYFTVERRLQKRTPSGGSGSVSRFKLTHYPSGDHAALTSMERKTSSVRSRPAFSMFYGS